MEVTEQIQTFQRFIEMHYLAQLLEGIRRGEMFFSVDFIALSKFSPELADLLLEQPEEVIKACELTISHFDVPADVKNFRIRFNNLPEQHKIFIRTIRSKHINKLVLIEGTVRQKSDVRPQVTSARFECPSCGNVMSILQLDSKFKEPIRCGCGRKGKFRLLSKELVDVQGIVLEEATKDLEGGSQPKRINVLLKNDLVSPMSDKKTNPGTNIQIIGTLKEVPIILRSGGQSTKFDLLVDVNNVIPLEEDYASIKLSDEDIAMIKELAKDPKIVEKLADSLAPGIYGHTRIKEALCLQFVGGVKKMRDDGVMSRGDIHMLLIGDPGAGKTVHKDTMITFDDGTICPIKEYVDHNFFGNGDSCSFDGVFVPTMNKMGMERKNKIIRLWKRKSENLFKVKTRTGKEIICTKTNPFFTPIPGHINVTKTKDLAPGDWIAAPRNITLDTKKQYFLMHNERTEVTSGFARFLGYILAEGYCAYNPSKGKYRIEFTNKDFILLRDFDALSRSLFGYTPKKYITKNNTQKLCIFSKLIATDLYALGPHIFKTSFYKRIPQCIMRSPNIVVSSFLQVFFECDGYVEKNHGIGITLASKFMIDQIQHLLLRFGILSQMHPTEKCATNTKNKTKRRYWKLHIYGENSQKFEEAIGFVSIRKKDLLASVNTTVNNTNLDVVPRLSPVLKYCREKLRMTQFNMNVPRSTYQHFERGDRYPSRGMLKKIVEAFKVRVCELLLVQQKAHEISVLSNREIFHGSQQEFGELIGCSQALVSKYELGKIRKKESFDYTTLKEKVFSILDDEKLFRYLNSLALHTESNIFWDQIVSIDPYSDKEPYIYDIEVEDTHNFIANGLYVHNSQLLKRAAVVAPKARFVSGKGVSGAGLCVSPDSMLLTNPGGIETIQNVIEERFDGNKRVQAGAWKKEDITDVKVQSLSHDLSIQSQYPHAIWKLEAPEIMYEITLSSGKKIEITGNTQLLTIQDGKILWKKSIELLEEEYIATPRKLIGGDVSAPYAIDFLSCNPVVHNIKPFVKQLTKKLIGKYGTKRAAAKELGLSEESLYYNWINKKARGNIKLTSLQVLADALGVPYKDKIMFVSLYNGKVHKIPFILNKDFLYFAGLIAGDGDIRKSGSTYSVRFSNKEQPLHSSFVKVVSEQFSLPFNIQKGNKHRPQATRTHSKILAQILFALGIPLSPKSHSLALSPTLLHLHNTLLCHYIAGLYDTDGSVCIRKTKGSDCIDLTTCSEQLARQLQLVFLRFDIHAKIRSRKPSGGAYNGKTIQGKLKKWILEVRGIEEIKRFAQSIPLRHPDKKKKLDDIIQKNVLSNTNKDIIPTIGNRIRHVLQKHHIPLRGLRQKRRFSRQYLQRMLLNVKIDDDELDNIKKIVFSDIFWEKIVSIKQKKTPYKYVYDLTVQDSHNFVVDGVLVHNTAAVVRDEFLAGWSLEAGAMVLSNKGILMIDEMDKMTDEDRSAMHEGMEQQTISISKANIQATLRCETTILAAANPKFGRFDPYETISRQINLPPALINRFDLIFTIKDLPDQERDTQLADFILHLHKKRGTKTVSIDTDTLRKYLIYARQEMSPHLTEEALVVLKEYYVKMRSSGGSDEKGIQAIPISPRQLEALVRLSEATAKLRLGEKTTKEDALAAIALFHYCLEQVGMDPETGKIDIDRISTGITTSERAKLVGVREIIAELEKSMNNKVIPIEEIIRAAQEKGLHEDKVHETIQKLKRSGDLFEPRKGHISRI